jgi:uncharacterized membrane protein YebE (DUF533 family)
MTDWMDSGAELDATAAAVIARGMRTVAQADGMIHQRELSLIAAFEAELPPGGDEDGQLTSDDAKVAYLRSLVMVALADGVITDSEEAVIGELCSAQGIGRSQIHSVTLEVKRWFLRSFRGVHIFRDAVVRVARDLGLSDAEVDALGDDA